MSAPHTIKGHAAMSAQELGLSPEIITRDTMPPVRVFQSSPDAMLHQIMAKFEQGFEHNFGSRK